MAIGPLAGGDTGEALELGILVFVTQQRLVRGVVLAKSGKSHEQDWGQRVVG